MNNYYEKYKMAKFTLNKLVCQFYDYDVEKEKADNLGINYTKDDIFNDLNKVACVFHRYNPEGMYLWNKLKIQKPIVLMRDMWDLRIQNEEEKNDVDYYREYLELKNIIASMVSKYYASTIDVNDMLRQKIDFNYIDLDEDTGIVHVCDHYHEGAGELSFKLLEIENSIISESEMINKKIELEKELLEHDCKKLKKIKHK